MEYKGSLYAKIYNKYLAISHTDDFEKLDNQTKELKASIDEKDAAIYNHKVSFMDLATTTNKTISELKGKLEVATKALEDSEKIFRRLADEGKYPEFMMAENGGNGIMFIVEALRIINLTKPTT